MCLEKSEETVERKLVTEARFRQVVLRKKEPLLLSNCWEMEQDENWKCYQILQLGGHQ